MAAKTNILSGFGFPVLRGQDGYFTVKKGYAAAWSDLVQVLFTPIGSRAFNRSFGSALHLAIFEPNDSDLQSLTSYYIRSAVAQWVPYVILHDIVVSRDLKNVSISIAFSLANDSTLENGNISVPVSALSNIAAAK